MKSNRVAAFFILLMLAGCSRSSSDLEPPYYPDDRGIVSKITVDTLQLDEGREYSIGSFVKSFSSYDDQKLLPLLQWANRYVHIGLDRDKTVVWIAGIGVVDKNANPPIVFYTNGVIDKTNRRNLVLKDGAVFELASGVEVPKTSNKVTLMIDASKHQVTRIVEQTS